MKSVYHKLKCLFFSYHRLPFTEDNNIRDMLDIKYEYLS